MATGSRSLPLGMVFPGLRQATLAGLGLAYASAGVLAEIMLYTARRVGPELFYWLLIPASIASACLGVYTGWSLVRWRLGWRTLALYGLLYAVVMGAAVSFLRPGLLLAEGFPSSVVLLGLQQAYHASLGAVFARLARSRLKRLGLLLFLYVFYPLMLFFYFMSYEDSSRFSWFGTLLIGSTVFLLPYPAMVFLVDLEPPYSVLKAVVPAVWMVLVTAVVAYHLLGGRTGDVPPSRERAWRPLLAGALCLALIASGVASAAIYMHAYTRTWSGAYNYNALVGTLDSEIIAAEILLASGPSEYVVSLSEAEYTLTTSSGANASCRVYAMTESEWGRIHNRAWEEGRISWAWSRKLSTILEVLDEKATEALLEELGTREGLSCNTTIAPIIVWNDMIVVIVLEVPTESLSVNYYCEVAGKVFSGTITGAQAVEVIRRANSTLLMFNGSVNCALSSIVSSLVQAKLIMKTRPEPDPWPIPGALVAAATASSTAALALIWRRFPAGGS